MAYIDISSSAEMMPDQNQVSSFLKRYQQAETVKDHWKDKFEEAYEYCLPQRESFYDETPG